MARLTGMRRKCVAAAVLAATGLASGGSARSWLWRPLSAVPLNLEWRARVVTQMLGIHTPLVDTQWSGPGTQNTWSPYDTLGRQVFFAVTGKF